MKVDIDVFKHEKDISKILRETFKKSDLKVINVMGSPGSGKTTFIESVICELGKEKCFVIEGDLSSKVDTKRLEKKAINAFQINTGNGCHLTSEDILKAVKKIEFTGKKYLFIENVGNLVCTANKDLGENLRILVSSTAEGDDKPEKYPIIFQFTNSVVISKTDLQKQCEFNKKKFTKDCLKLNSKLKIFEFEKGKKMSKEIIDFLK